MIIKLGGLIPFGMGFIREDGDYVPPRNGSDATTSDMEVGDSGEDMSPKAYIMKINKMTAELYNKMQNDGGMEDWVSEKVKEAHALLNSVHGHVTFQIDRPDSLPQPTAGAQAPVTRDY